ncbi:hypothetical protein CONLIGDRAFT_679875 [Coniochaeta ligniaria NRRL 30616]|uniref:Autophagy-related protein 29 n=1 Tax=Coniochaeta ligniaria NRRL 30616 TaxID=1408157 RepID=A0A1J7JCS9_9PEZI|nr:hypothetical protein CONLIGDRAFT_679875 [Coniochaeta ligniaria NRRL 30616]
MAREMPKIEPKYEIYVRLPFNRGDFVDPPPVDWNDTKSDALWNIISDVERTDSKIDWNELATSFGVGVDFLLMMAQTLAERHTNQLMGLFRSAAVATGAGTSGAVSPVNAGFPSGISSAPDTTTAASGESMKRAPSGSGNNRPASPTSARRDSPLPRTTNIGTPGAGTPLKSSLAVLRPPVISRTSTPSINTTVLTQNNPASAPAPDLSSSKPPPQAGAKSPLPPRHRPSTLHLSTTSPPPQDPPSSPPSPAKSESSSSSSSSSSPAQSRIIKRPPRPTPKPAAPTTSLSIFPDDDEEEEEAEPAFLPYQSPAPAPAASAGSSDLAATLRGAPSSSSSRRVQNKAAATAFLSSHEGSEVRESQTSDSSTSSAAAKVRRGHVAGAGGGGGGGGGGPLSPRRTAELAKKGREGSDGTPSMGSSFSDLDDASVTQSALEEALASNMQDGGATVGSRMSTFGNAFKSRYLPKSNR